jgi:hypothetical protein
MISSNSSFSNYKLLKKKRFKKVKRSWRKSFTSIVTHARSVTQNNDSHQDSGAGVNLSGEYRQMGQVAFNRSHSSMQSEWKQCLHSGMVFSVSLGLYSHKHIEQVLSSGLGNLLLSPRTILG